MFSEPFILIALKNPRSIQFSLLKNI